MLTLIALALFGFVFYRMTSADDRKRLAAWLLVWIRRAMQVVRATPATLAFDQALRARTRWEIATPALVAINAVLFVWMVMAPGPIASPETLVAWGGSLGPRTTNGEWWRLATAPFLHTGFVALALNMLGLVQPARLLERLVGPLALVSVYVVAGMAATVVSLPQDPLGVTVGASGAVCGVYGLLLTAAIRGMFPRSALTIPLGMFRIIAPAAAAFAVFNLFAGGVPLSGELAGLFAGVAAGTALVRRVSEVRPPARRVGYTFATAMAMAVVAAVPLRGVVDVRPELRSIVALEDRTARAYDAAVSRFRVGRLTDAALVAVIEDQILPELGQAQDGLRTPGRVLTQHARFIDDAEQYLRLRQESWRLRLDGLTGASLAKLREADVREHAALVLLSRFRSA